ncbi:MAG: hypothetical protein OXG88_05380 [Gammaproteobacteria bacterium]|nr:hypothetical protein [Gammaproteobacteria bacterium]
MPQSKLDKKVLAKYAECVEEVKRRVQVIQEILAGQIHTKFVMTTAESLALQFRNVLELIVLASLVANKEEYAKRRENFHKEWRVKDIIKQLEEINPKYYPKPYRDKPDGDKEIEDITSGYLTKNEYLILFSECNKMIHADNPFAPRKKNPETFLRFAKNWRKKISLLLNQHRVQLIDTKVEIWVLMQKSTDGNVGVYEFQQVP